MLPGRSKSQLHDSASGEVSVEPMLERKMMRSPQVSTLICVSSSQTYCCKPAPA